MSLKTGLIGIGGFGRVHAATMLELQREGRLQCMAFADPNIEKSQETYASLMESGAKHYLSYERMMEEHPELDFIAIATPIHLHKEMAIQVMKKGFHVLLEKPPAVAIQDIDEIIDVQRLTKKHCAVNFQNATGEAFRLLLDKMANGDMGDILEVTGVGMWKRTQQYYDRSPWAGKLTVGGKLVLDGTLSNPFAHLVQNCLLAAGAGRTEAAVPASIQAELYKGHQIEGEDTASIRIKTEQGAEIKVYTTLCHDSGDTPYILIKGSRGSAYWNYRNILRVNQTGQGEEISQYEEKQTPQLTKNIYTNLIGVLSGMEQELYAPIHSCRHFVMVLNGAYESSKGTHKIPDGYLEIYPEEQTIATTLKGSKELFDQAVRTGKLFSEIPVEWGVESEIIKLKGYQHFTLPSGCE